MPETGENLLTFVHQVVYVGSMKIRTNIYLTAEQKAALDRLSSKSGAPVAELIRRFVDAGLKKEAGRGAQR